jgi:small conductance mechanosensitive channel
MHFFTTENIRAVANAYLFPTGVNILIALAVFFVGRWLARLLVKGGNKLMERADLDVSLRKFLSDVAYAVMLVMVVTAALDQMGIKTTAVVAVLGAAGLAIGLALQGSLSNFAAGVMIIVLRPYKVGDVINVNKYVGSVEAIRVFNTVLITPDNREITIPNGQVISGPIENMTVLGRRRVDIDIKVGYEADLRKVKEVLEGILAADARVLSEPRAEVKVAELGGGAITLAVRPWVKNEDHGPVWAETLERIKQSFDVYEIKLV